MLGQNLYSYRNRKNIFPPCFSARCSIRKRVFYFIRWSVFFFPWYSVCRSVDYFIYYYDTNVFSKYRSGSPPRDTCQSSGILLFELLLLLSGVANKATSFPRISSDSIFLVDQLRNFLWATLPILARNLSKNLVEHFPKLSHTTTEIRRTLLIQVHIGKL